MKMKYCFVALSLFLSLRQTAEAGDNRKMSREEYIAEYQDDAVRDMQKTGVPASITLAQALLESNDGNSPLAVEANNHFGIKCAGWNGPTFLHDDDKRDDCFRKYNSVFESYDDHSLFLKSRPRYASLFELRQDDYKSWAKGLKKAGYATDPHYADRLVKIIEDHHLYDLDHPQSNSMTASNYPDNPVPEKESGSPNEVREANEYHPRHLNHVMVASVEAVDAFSHRTVEQINGVDFIRARRGDTYQRIAREFELGSWQLPKYNETESSGELLEGQVVYLKPKKSSGSGPEYITKDGDSVYSVSQATGIKMKFICKYNGLHEGDTLEAGRRILLRKKNS